MERRQHSIPITRTGVYYTAGDPDSRYAWLCCHGYGQLGDRLVSKFEGVIAQDHRIVSVEAPHRFYWEGVRGRPVANWMTSRYRLNDIKDNNVYLNDVYHKEMAQSDTKVLFGFSQGGTTLWRWIHECQPDFDVFINYAGWIPEDVDLSTLADYCKDKRLIFIYGKNDEYLTQDRISGLKEVVSKSRLNMEIKQIEGKHRIDSSVLTDLAMEF